MTFAASKEQEAKLGLGVPGGAAGSAEPGNAEPQLGKLGKLGNEATSPGSEPPAPDSSPSPHCGWYSRGYLPHRDHPGLLQAITYRLADSLPAEALSRLDAELRRLPPEKQDAARRRRIEAWLDGGHGSCALSWPEAAVCVVDTWQRFAGERYDLIAWVVMPNHVHVLIRTYEGVALGKIVQSWKSYTGRRIGEMMDARGSRPGSRPGGRGSQGRGSQRRGSQGAQGVWMREYWDRFIRNEAHFCAAVDYIHQNPVKAGLVARAEDWPWSSAREFTMSDATARLGSGGAEGAKLGLGAPGRAEP